MSPLLFKLYIANLDMYLKRRGIGGGVKIGQIRIWFLAYADDLGKEKRDVLKKL